MSHPDAPLRPESPEALPDARRDLHRRGGAFGFEYDVGLRITTLTGAELEFRRPPLRPGMLRLATPEPGRSTNVSTAGGVAGGESAGGR